MPRSSGWLRCWLFLLWLIAVLSLPVVAQQSANPSDQTATPPPPVRTAPAQKSPSPPDATGPNPTTSNATTPPKVETKPSPVNLILTDKAECRSPQGKPKNCELGDTLYVGFTNLPEWMADNKDKNKPNDLVLVLNDRVMKGLKARGPDTSFKELEFDLKRLDGDEPDSKENRDAWSALLSRSKGNRTVEVSVALAGNPPYFGPATATVQAFPSYSWLVVIFLLALLIGFLLLARQSDILRDAPSAPGGPKMTYSLARCQMAWWFFIIVSTYNYIWMVTGDRDSLTAGALMLTGISAATGLGAVMVDSSKRDQRQSLQTEQQTITARLAELGPAIAAVPSPANLIDLKAEQLQKQTRLAEINTALGNLPSPPGPSNGLLLDILRDETGVSFHRFQMAAWTIVLGFVFVVGVYKSLAMPDFSALLLGLMGISSGTYLGFKLTDPPK